MKAPQNPVAKYRQICNTQRTEDRWDFNLVVDVPVKCEESEIHDRCWQLNRTISTTSPAL